MFQLDWCQEVLPAVFQYGHSRAGFRSEMPVSEFDRSMGEAGRIEMDVVSKAEDNIRIGLMKRNLLFQLVWPPDVIRIKEGTQI